MAAHLSTPKTNVAEFSVSTLAQALKKLVEGQFSHVRVRAEISGLKRAASGHVYFGLKDEHAVIDAVCWRGVAGTFNFKPEDGLEVICTGKISTYPARSKYQIIVEKMEPAGAGALMALLEERRQKLAGEGLFDDSKKSALPFLPDVIGVVTSPSGSVIRDIIHRLRERFARHVIVWPVLVQGEGAADQIANAITGFNAIQPGGPVTRPDLIIVARGGGSVEDLWAFNEENVVRAAAASQIPLISAVGHETDTTLIDFAADLRAPTPTGAAEKAVPVRAELLYTLADQERRLARIRVRMIKDRQNQLKSLARGLPDLKSLLGLPVQELDNLTERLPRALHSVRHMGQARLNRLDGALQPSAIKQQIEHKKDQLEGLGQRHYTAIGRLLKERKDKIGAMQRLLGSLSFQHVLERGFALVEDDTGHPVTSAHKLQPFQQVTLSFHDGKRRATLNGDDDGKGHKVRSGKAAGYASDKKRRKQKKKSESADKQGQLF